MVNTELLVNYDIRLLFINEIFMGVKNLSI